MRKIFQLIVFIKNLSTGIMIPILTLALLKHGASINTVSLLIGAYSFTVIVAEFPSGLFADLCGRKKTFMISMVLYLLCFSIILFTESRIFLFVAMILNGLGRAFSSGSIDALAIDDTIALGGVLVKVTARLSVLENAGLAMGALVGGLLSNIGTRYEGNLFASLLLYVLLLVLAFFVQEQEHMEEESEVVQKLDFLYIYNQIKEVFSFMKQKGTVRLLLLFSFITGFALLAIETYWQPALLEITSLSWILGGVSFFCFACVMAGSRLAEYILSQYSHAGERLLIGLKASMGVGLIILAFQTKIPTFIGVYMLIYFFVGSCSVVENTLLNSAAPTQQRASIMSMFSFVLQVGGLLASLCGYVVSTNSDYRNIWYVAGSILLLGAAIYEWIFLQNKLKLRRSVENDTKF